jgi:eukaryotic-like serine/threonine-protein kinase
MALRRRYRRATPPPPDEWPTVVQEGPAPPVAPPPVEPDREWWPWVVVLLVAVVIIAGLAAYFATRDGGKKVIVPAVVGDSESAARSKLDHVGLRSRVGRVFSAKKLGLVVSQAPGGGTQVAGGGVVALTVSKGQAAVAVPNLVSLTEADAVAQLTRAGLRADVVQVPSNERPGTVVAQSPVGGTTVDAGSTVRLNASKGRTQTTTVTTPTTVTTTQTTTSTTPTTTTSQSTIPEVVGTGLSEAVSQMGADDLLADSYPVSSDQPGGTVVSQSPTSGSSVRSGSVVRLSVSTGTVRPALAVPDVTGATQSAAREALSKTFTLRTVFRSGRSGIVVGQLPAAGGQARRWAQVIIYVGR